MEKSSKTLLMKFGGTSVGSPEAMRNVVQIIRDTHKTWPRLVVVTSAFSGVTDQLIESSVQAAAGDLSIVSQTSIDLHNRHHAMIDAMVPKNGRRAKLYQEVDQLLAEFSSLCQAISVLGEASPRARDTVAGIGERLCVRILAEAVIDETIQSLMIESTQLIITDSHFQNAHPDMERTLEQVTRILVPALDQGLVPITTGFIAADKNGVTTTLGRGGSDYSASLLAVTLHADEVWIWTDVDGVMTADPRLVPNARTIPSLSFREVAEMAFYGAKVLHPKSIQPVIASGIALRVCNTFNPAHPGTRLCANNGSTSGTIKALTAIRGLQLITLSGTGMLGVPGVAARIFTAVAKTGISLPLIIESTSEQAICFPAPKEKIAEILQVLHDHLGDEFEQGDIDRASTSEDVDIITVVCPNLRTTPGIAGQIFSCLAAANINVLGISIGASDVSANLIVSARDTRDALKELHKLI
ncbi:MAG: aspartate kinase [Anaerolineaceae bacterium]